MPKTEWVKPWEREYNVLKMDMVLCSMRTDYFRSVYGFDIPRSFAMRMPNGNDAVFVEKKSYNRWINETRAIMLSKRRFDDYYRRYCALRSEIIAVAKKVGVYGQRISNSDMLRKLLRSFEDVDQRNMSVGQWGSFLLTEHAVVATHKLVERFIAGVSRQKEIEKVLFSPGEMSQIRKERQSILSVALALTEKERQRLLRRHAASFEWIPCINIIEPKAWPQSHFVSELKQIPSSGEARKELEELEKSFKKNRAAYNRIKKQFPRSEQALLDRLHAMSFIKDDRDDTRRKAYYYATPLFQQISRVLGCDENDMPYYTYDEIDYALAVRKPLAPSIVRARRKRYVLVPGIGGSRVVPDREYKNYLKMVRRVRPDTDEVRGVAASSGVVRGRACIVPNVYSIDKMKKHMVLVTVVTHPDYVPAMRRAAAFVTDEGGMTSHAAIVAREMKKPCVVGTVHATELFRDGDLLEVDAEHGIVRKV